MICLVFDTNVLIAAARAPQSASRQLIAACLEGRAEAAVSNALRGEYELLIRKALFGVPYAEELY